MQHPEVSCMDRSEYDAFIKNPFGFIVDKVLPRVYKALDSEGAGYGMSLVRAMNIQTDMTTPILMEAGRVSKKYGLPLTGAGLVEAPMDYISDMIRGFSFHFICLFLCVKKILQNFGGRLLKKW